MLDPVSNKLQRKYRYTAWFYDFLDYPWERLYRKWRGDILRDTSGAVLEVGVGTGRNLAYYPKDVSLTAIDISSQMLALASRRAKKAKCAVMLKNMDASTLEPLADNHFDWLIGTFLC